MQSKFANSEIAVMIQRIKTKVIRTANDQRKNWMNMKEVVNQVFVYLF